MNTDIIYQIQKDFIALQEINRKRELSDRCDYYGAPD